MRNGIALAAFGLLLSACSTTNVGLKYVPTTTVANTQDAQYAVAIGPFLDKREETGTWLGAIRGGYGNPIKNLEAERPVAEMVKSAFSEGLRSRGITIADEGKNKVIGTVTKLECNQYVRREAYVDIEISVLDQAGQQKFTKTYSASKVEGSLITLDAGVFASVDDLRIVLEKTLRQAIDQALDDHALIAALQP